MDEEDTINFFIMTQTSFASTVNINHAGLILYNKQCNTLNQILYN